MIPKDFDQAESGTMLYHRAGDMLVVVQVLGRGVGGPWAYTVWDGNKCVRGAAHLDWTAMDACANAREALTRATNKRKA